LYYLVVGVTAVWHHAIFSRLDIASLVFFYYNLQAVYLGHHLADVNSLWSLAVEEQFYIVWPTVVLLFSKRTLVRISLVGMLVALILRLIILPQATVFQSAYYLTPCRMDALLAGALLAVWRTDGEAWKRVKRFAAPAALVSSAILSGIALWTGHFYDFVTKSTVAGQHLRHSSYLVLGPGCTFLAVLFASAVVQCTEPGKVSRIFDWQPLRRIGKYSYGMYLFHWLILMILHKFGLTHIRDLPFDGSAIVCFMLLLCASFAAAFISFHVYEKHFLRLKRLFPAVAFQRETRVSR
jgi:peptidoglycan/LPS O-acetylase OafA/YrhL